MKVNTGATTAATTSTSIAVTPPPNSDTTGATAATGATVATRALPNGEVLVAGGFDGSNDELSSTEIYDPVVNAATSFGRDRHRARRGGLRLRVRQ